MTLESFDAEAAGPVDTLRAEVSLADAAAGGGFASWSEAVAVVEALCEALTLGGRDDRVPALEDILLNGEGRVWIAYGSRGEQGPVAAGRLLSVLLGSTEVPVQLRLFVSQATAPGTHASVGEFAAGLGYFGRPDRVELIQAVYRRCASRPPAARSAAVPPPIPQQEQEPRGPRDRRRPASSALPWVAAALLLVVAGAGVWFWTGRSPAEGASFTAADAASVVTGAFEDVKATARDLMGEPRIVPRENGAQPGGEPSPSAAGTSVAGPVPIRPSAARAAPATSTPARTVATTALTPSAPRGTADATAAPAQPLADEGRTADVADRPRETLAAVIVADPAAIYSQADLDVVPPSLVAPQLPMPLVSIEDQAPTVNRMELLVAADGTVERVRLLAGPRRMPDMMLLSGAKTWKFAPALKDGVPVRYRTVLSWTVTP